MNDCPHCGHDLAEHRGEPFVISSQGCAVWPCSCMVPGPALKLCGDFMAQRRSA